MIKAKSVPGGTLLTTERSEPQKVVLDPDDFLRAVHAVADRYECEPRELVLNDLAYRVAISNEPEFQVKFEAKRATKPTLWTPTKLWRLWFDVRTLMHQNQGKTVAWCVNRTKKLPHWQGLEPSVRRYYDARDSQFGQMLEQLEARIGADKTLEILAGVKWERLP